MNPILSSLIELKRAMELSEAFGNNISSIMDADNFLISGTNKDSDSSSWTMGIQLASVTVGVCVGVVLIMAYKGIRKIQANQVNKEIVLKTSDEIGKSSLSKS